jgi:hypothetical protein
MIVERTGAWMFHPGCAPDNNILVRLDGGFWTIVAFKGEGRMWPGRAGPRLWTAS